ncbi:MULTISPECIES: hypothetical protein [unclassified Methanosarcina]|uniref:hypothetical protein n=1 Tax=unclassified Methanosarcina TaxID=2644672 RepID=UPI000A68CD78|nr:MULTISPECIES: hypothetical protein [unclassified Methanosarcina]
MAGTKSMGLWAAASIGVGAMVGAGIFSIFGTATRISGNAVYIYLSSLQELLPF